jgi:hypothetical protein
MSGASWPSRLLTVDVQAAQFCGYNSQRLTGPTLSLPSIQRNRL